MFPVPMTPTLNIAASVHNAEPRTSAHDAIKLLAGPAGPVGAIPDPRGDSRIPPRAKAWNPAAGHGTLDLRYVGQHGEVEAVTLAFLKNTDTGPAPLSRTCSCPAVTLPATVTVQVRC